MATRSLIERIERLPPEKVERVERVVAELESNPAADLPAGDVFPADLLHAIDTDRESLRRQLGFIETDPVLRDLRENGG